ncbi:MAG: cell division protein ZapA [Actinomycetota bacterium]|nr:cell division protein ZapA [Actinomycetota bacterium]MDA8174740.1 cell division protein ZapA [Nitrospiraceae bacterium]
MRNKTEVRIFGQKFTLRSDQSEERMQEIAAYVDGQIQEVLSKSPGISALNAAILAALNIAGQYHSLKQEQDEAAVRISHKAEILSSLFE